VTSAPAPAAPAAPPDAQAALLDALRAVLEPLSQLAVARGLPFAAVDELLRGAFVNAAHAAHPGLPEHRRVSRVSVATGLNRREVTRLTQKHRDDGAATARSYPSELFAHWTTQPAYRDVHGQPRVLPRLGAAPSFEALAQGVTRDMHPRSLLEELLRLGLAVHDIEQDTVALARESFVPRGDAARMAGFLGANVGDHLSAAVANVLGDGRQHFEQALFADGLSESSLLALREHVARHWRALTEDLVPRLEQMIAADEKAGVGAGQRLRLGLFSFEAPVNATGPSNVVVSKGRARLPGPARPPDTAAKPTKPLVGRKAAPQKTAKARKPRRAQGDSE
jgi:hypothetical protein